MCDAIIDRWFLATIDHLCTLTLRPTTRSCTRRVICTTCPTTGARISAKNSSKPCYVDTALFLSIVDHKRFAFRLYRKPNGVLNHTLVDTIIRNLSAYRLPPC